MELKRNVYMLTFFNFLSCPQNLYIVIKNARMSEWQTEWNSISLRYCFHRWGSVIICNSYSRFVSQNINVVGIVIISQWGELQYKMASSMNFAEDEDKASEDTEVKWINIIFVPFHYYLKLLVLMAVIIKCIMVSTQDINVILFSIMF